MITSISSRIVILSSFLKIKLTPNEYVASVYTEAVEPVLMTSTIICTKFSALVAAAPEPAAPEIF